MQQLTSKPSVFWGWNGKITKQEITYQLEDFKSKGIGGVFVHSRAGLKIEYMGELWLELFVFAVSECERLSLDLWIYDEDGWPSGFGGGKVLMANEEFKAKYTNVFKGYARDFYQSDKANNLYGVYSLEKDKFIKLDNNLINKENEKEQLYFIYVETNDYYIDVTNKEAVKEFVDVTHEQYKKVCEKYFGKVIKGIFTDEPHVRPDGIPIGKYVESEFFNDNGYIQKVGITGISWGGMITTTVIQYDDRFSFAMPVYGSMSLIESSGIQKNVPPVWDTIDGLKQTACKTFFVNSMFDPHFSMDATQRCAQTSNGSILLKQTFPHGQEYGAYEPNLPFFADNFCKKNDEFVEIVKHPTKDDPVIQYKKNGKVNIDKLEIVYTESDKINTKTVWNRTEVEVSSKYDDYFLKLPKNAKYCFVHITYNTNLEVSSYLVKMY